MTVTSSFSHSFRALRQSLRNTCLLLLGTAAWQLPATAQQDSIHHYFGQYRRQTLHEKLYLHLDRGQYLSGETMWFKLYATDASRHQPLDLSRVAYVEVLDAENKPVLQGKIRMQQGAGQGSFVVPATLESGRYRVRAYTNWMKNFSPDLYFEQPLILINPGRSLPTPGTQTDTLNYAVQFFPEGGQLVQGLSSKVAFQAVDARGRGLNFQGEIRDQRGAVIARFTPNGTGMGAFTFTPAPQERYQAVLTFANKRQLVRPLPAAQSQGFVMRVEPAGNDQLRILVQARDHGAPLPAQPVHLLAHTRLQNPIVQTSLLDHGQATFVLSKGALAEGITHLTLFTDQRMPVCERLYFKRPENKNLRLAVSTSQGSYAPREKVSLRLTAAALAGTADQANLSVAVYRVDSLNQNPEADIYSYLWLNSDLRGPVRDPAFYLDQTGAAAEEALDLLMLTQGWRRFRWEDVFRKRNFAFAPERNGHLIRGRVTQISNGAPAPGITTYLASPSRLVRLYTATSNAQGQIQFEVKDFTGTRDVVVQSNFAQDSTCHFELFNPFSEAYSRNPLPAFRLHEAQAPLLEQRFLETQVHNAYFGRYRNLFQSSQIDSSAFYGKPDEHYRLDDFTRFKVMEEVMREYVPGVLVRIRKDGFHFLVADRVNSTVFNNNPMVLLDGVPVFNINKIMAFDPLKVEKLDVLTRRYFHGSQIYDGLVSYRTYTGDLNGFNLDARALLTEYEGLQLPREFYAPAYDTPARQQSRLADLRNLLYWNPQVLTAGQQQLEFYTGDQAGTYRVMVQGLSREGRAGSVTHTFEVKGGM